MSILWWYLRLAMPAFSLIFFKINVQHYFNSWGSNFTPRCLIRHRYGAEYLGIIGTRNADGLFMAGNNSIFTIFENASAVIISRFLALLAILLGRDAYIVINEPNIADCHFS